MIATSPNANARVIHQIRQTIDKQVETFHLDASPNGTLPSGILGTVGATADAFYPSYSWKNLEFSKDRLVVWEDRTLMENGKVLREKNGLAEADEVSYLTAVAGSVRNVAPGLLGISSGITVDNQQVVEEMSYLLTK